MSFEGILDILRENKKQKSIKKNLAKNQWFWFVSWIVTPSNVRCQYLTYL